MLEEHYFTPALRSLPGHISPKSISVEDTAHYLERQINNTLYLNQIGAYRRGNRKVAQEYMDEEELFDMSFDGIHKWQKDNPYLLDDVIRFVVQTNISMLRQMDEENTAVREELERLKGSLRHPFRTFVCAALQ